MAAAIIALTDIGSPGSLPIPCWASLALSLTTTKYPLYVKYMPIHTKYTKIYAIKFYIFITIIMKRIFHSHFLKLHF